MHFVGKVHDDFKELLFVVFKFGFGAEKSRTNYLKSQQYTSHVHSMMINNGIIEDEDQMPFMNGYLMPSDDESNDDSDTSDDSEISKNSNSNKTEISDLEDPEECLYKENTDQSLRNILKINSLNNEWDVKDKINETVNSIPSDKQFTNSLNWRVLYKILIYFRRRFESLFTVLETEYNHSKFFSNESYK